MGFTGTTITQDPDIKIWDPKTGWTIRRPWRGSPAQVDLLLTPPGDPDGFPTEEYVRRKKDLDDLVAGSKVLSDIDWWNAPVRDYPPASTNMKRFVASIMRGVTSFTVSQFVLRQTVVVASNYSIRPAYTNVGKILTTTQVQEIHAIPSTLMFSLPAGYWLERTPTTEQTASDKFTITREWWHSDDYDNFLYDPS